MIISKNAKWKNYNSPMNIRSIAENPVKSRQHKRNNYGII